MSNMMRAVVVKEIGADYSVTEIPVPEPAADEALVRMVHSGICPTDMSISDGDWCMKRPKLPYVPGHEGSGYIAALGSGVRGLKEGDRVGVFWLNSTCGCCEDCTTARENICIKQTNTGYTRNGTHAEFCVVNANYLIPLPDGRFEDLTPVMCAGVTSYKAVKKLNVHPGGRIIVTGVGSTGHLAIQFAKRLGYEVVAMDLSEERLALAKEFGADITINARESVNRMSLLVKGAHGAIVTAPEIASYEQALRLLRRGGTCVLLGVPQQSLSIPMLSTIINELTLTGTVVGTRQDVREALEFVSRGQVRVLSELRPLEEVNQAVKDVRSGKASGRVLLDITQQT